VTPSVFLTLFNLKQHQMKYSLAIIAFWAIGTIKAQSPILKPTHLNYEMDSLTKGRILSRLDTLFVQIKNNKLDAQLVGKGETDFNTLKSFSDIEDNKKDSILNFYKKELIDNLKKYLKENPKTKLLDLFTKPPKIFNHLAPEISVKSTLSSLICAEIEQKKGIEGIKALINCGSGDDNFFKVVNELIAINKTNFDVEVGKLITQFK
jgi:hypothetical protein